MGRMSWPGANYGDTLTGSVGVAPSGVGLAGALPQSSSQALPLCRLERPPNKGVTEGVATKSTAGALNNR